MKRRRHAPAGERSIRALKMGEAMRHALAEILTREVVHDGLLARHILSVSEVRLSPDLRNATAYVVAVGADAAAEDEVLATLNRHAPQFRAAVAQRVSSRYAAEIRFEVDSSYAEGAKIDALLRRPEVARDLAGDGDSAEDQQSGDQRVGTGSSPE